MGRGSIERRLCYTDERGVKGAQLGRLAMRGPRWNFEELIRPRQLHAYLEVELGIERKPSQCKCTRVGGLTDRELTGRQAIGTLRRAINDMHDDTIIV